MDATVNDFFKEINQISSTSSSKASSITAAPLQEDVWQECYDELTGYSYFWNTESDEVTWVPPKSYKPAGVAKKGIRRPSTERDKKKVELFVPPASNYHSTNVNINDLSKVKVYSLQEVIKKPEDKKVEKPTPKPPAKKPPRDDSDDEKIELITEYGESSDSEEEVTTKPNGSAKLSSLATPSTVTTIKSKKATSSPVLPDKNAKSKEKILSEDEDEDDETDLLAKIQQRAQELKSLGGTVPAVVKDIIQQTQPAQQKASAQKNVSAFALVAGYHSDSSEDELEAEKPSKSLFPVGPPPPQNITETSHSTLFPITKPIDVKDFIKTESPTHDNSELAKPTSSPNNDFDSKVFQRKRRIGVSLVNQVKRPKGAPENEDFTGLGFKQDRQLQEETKDVKLELESPYQGFQKGGVMFVKSDVLNPAKEEVQEEKSVKEESNFNARETEADYTVLKEKLLFLGEGRDPVLPVQTMLIQAETLFVAMKEGGLKLSYLYKWLKEMCAELVKLEKETAPEGWLLQWDRSHKRYFYQNQATGASQWKYPEPDVTRCDDAMDISTTPPPPDLEHVTSNIEVNKPPSPVVFGPQLPVDPPLPPSPPNIRSPTPPPPPIITPDLRESKIPVVADVPLPPKPPSISLAPSQPICENNQPLPPGVDVLPDSYTNGKKTLQKVPDSLSSVLDSFYSEIAEVTENTNSLSPTSSTVPQDSIVDVAVEATSQVNQEAVKKKKKKVKLVQGLTMKKKGVSQLVEKWKNVQKSYGD